MMRYLAAPAIFLIGLVAAVQVQAEPSDYGIERFDASLTSAGAGAHADLTSSFDLKRESSGLLFAPTREVTIALPPGFSGNPSAVPQCSSAQLTSTDITDPAADSSCPIDSQVGITEVTVFNRGGVRTLVEPIYNMAPTEDVVARLGFIAEFIPVFIDIGIRSENDYGITATVRAASSLIPLLSATTTLWALPAAPSHDPERVTPYEALSCGSAPCTAPAGLPRQSGLVPVPFLSNPTNCSDPLRLALTARSYALPDQPASATATLPQITGCRTLGFSPAIAASPTTREPAAPTGLDVELTSPQDETPQGLATSQIRDTVVSFPQGMTIAPGAADGLEACSAEQAGYRSRDPAQCPEAAKLGTAEVDVPGLTRPISGALYQRTPEPGNLFRVWLIADDLGLHIALPGELSVDETTGQISAAFLGMPQAPVRKARIHVFGGAHAPLATPASCGAYSTHYTVTPWSGTDAVQGDSSMAIDQDCGGERFAPALSAGSATPVAGSFSSFLTTVFRRSRESNISALQLTLPEGVSAKLTGIPLCAGAAAVSGKCPAASRIGEARVAAGPGPAPLWLPQPGRDPIEVYLGGPYKGAPLSLVVTAPAQAGPFDLGTVITRAAIEIDPNNARATVTSDPLPQILKGVPITYRTIHIDLDRPGFILNPTSCEPMAVRGVATSTTGERAPLSSAFQVDGCRGLSFKPSLSLTLKGPTKRTSHPRLIANLVAHRGEANLARAQVKLPKAAFLDQDHIKSICTRVQFAADTCPSGSIYGKASATSPLLDSPLSGPVYLRSSSHALPDLVVKLRGPATQPIEIDLVGRTDSIKGALRNTFEAVPDAPVTKFHLELFGGKRGLVELSAGLCAHPRAAVKLDAHNGMHHDTNPIVRTSCSLRPRQGRDRTGS